MVTNVSKNFYDLPTQDQTVWVDRAIMMKDNDHTKEYFEITIYNLAEMLYNRSIEMK